MLTQGPEEQFEELKAKLLAEVKSTFPIRDASGGIEVRVKDLRVTDEGGLDDIEGQTDAKTTGKTWGAPVSGTIEVVDTKTGKVLSTKKNTRIADIPKLTKQYSYIVGGGEKSISNQWRLRPGAYVRATEKDGEFKAQFQLSKGKAFDVNMDPGTGYMYLNVGRKVPLYSVLHASGVSDEEMKKHWGEKAFAANKAKSNLDRDVKALASKIYLPKDVAESGRPDLIVQGFYNSTKMDPEITGTTLGKKLDQVNHEALLRASSKLMGVSSGKTRPDPIDSIQFKELWSASDHFSDRIAKSRDEITKRVQKGLNRPQVVAQLRSGNPSAIRNVVQPDLFQKPLLHVFSSAGLSREANQINPVSMLSDRSATTIMGPGGIENPHAVTHSNVAVDPSQLGFVDPVYTPESDPGQTTHLAAGVTIKNRKPHVRLYNLKTGRTEEVTPEVAARSAVVFPDQVKWKNGKPTPLKPSVRVNDEQGRIRDMPFAKAKYALVDQSQMFAVESNLVPFMGNDSAGRTTMSARHMGQAISIVGREAPLVQVGKNKQSLEKLVGSNFLACRTPIDGVVKAVEKNHILVEGKNGEVKKVGIYNHYPLNDKKAMLHSEPQVKVGDRVKKDQLLADNNYTKDGALALGTNLRTAYIANGGNHEDGIVISESAAKKMQSEHLLKPSLYATKDLVVDKKKFFAHKGTAFESKQYDHIDDSGVAKVGATINPGDPLILALKDNRQADTIDNKTLKALSRSGRQSFTNASLTWDHEHPGEVVRISRSGKNVVVHVKTKEPATVGSKISTRHSAKGIVTEIIPDKEMPRTKDGRHVEMMINPTCYDERTEFLTRRGWVYGRDLREDDEFASLAKSTMTLEWQKSSLLVKEPYRGKMYHVENEQIDLLVTPNHRMLSAPRVKGEGGTLGSLDFAKVNPEHFTDATAEEVFGQARRYLKAAQWKAEDPGPVRIEAGVKRQTGQPKDGFEVPSLVWAEFMGWFLAEGYTTFNESSYSYMVGISASTKRGGECRQRVEALLTEMGVAFSAIEAGYVIRHKGLYERLAPLGKCETKYIPREVLDLPTEHLARFLDAFVAGDGNTRWRPESGHYNTRRVSSNSKLLMDGLQEVCMKLGLSMNIKEDPRTEKYRSEAHYTASIGSRCKAPWVNWSKEAKAKQVEEWVDYDGMIYCCSVPNTFIAVRRNGKAVLSGNSVPGRMNPGQILETNAARIAEKTGKPYIVENFQAGTDALKKVQSDLKKHGLKDSEELYDPKTGRKLGNVTVGPHYAFQMVHQIDKKTHARHGGFTLKGKAPVIHYDNNKVPRGGGHTGAQSLGSLGIYGALAAGLKSNLEEMQTLKSDQPQAEAAFRALANGEMLPTPEIPFTYKKFEAQLQGLGLQVRKEGSELRLVPSTDKEIEALSSGEVKRPERMVLAKSGKPEKGGLFDPRIFDAENGNRWGHISLGEPMPNPVFGDTIANVLNIKKKDIPEILSGRKELGKYGKGSQAFEKALKAINIDKEMASAKELLKDPKIKGGELNRVHHVYRALENLKKEGMKPHESFMLRKVPVLPTVYRPYTQGEDGVDRNDPLNQLYRRLGMVNSSINEEKKLGLPQSQRLKSQEGLYQELQNLMGTTPKGKKALDLDFKGNQVKDRELKGILHSIAGDQPKDGFFQSRMVGKKQDYSARATIVVDPGLGPDTVGVPKKVAMEIFRPHVARQLVLGGKDPIGAHDEIQKRTPVAVAALKRVIEENPVLMKRDPVLHQYGLVGQKVALTNKKAITVSPLILPPMGGDIDGDQMALFTPLSREAKEEARRIMPSQRPLSGASGDVLYQPSNEAALSLYRTTIPRKKSNKVFKTAEDAEKAFNGNRLDLDELVTIAGTQTTLGRARIAKVVPEKYKKQVLTDHKRPFDKKMMHEVLKYTATQEPKKFEAVATNLMKTGFKSAYDSGHSVTLKDLEPLRTQRDRIISETARRVKSLKDPNAQIDAWFNASDKLHSTYEQHYQKKPTNISDMRASGIKAKKEQFQGLLMAPLLTYDHLGKPVTTPITKSFAEGIDLSGYWMQAQGARRGVIQKTDSVREPGYMSKLLVNMNIDQPITGKDCRTTQGMFMPINNKDVVDRHLASPVALKGRTIAAGTPVTPDLVREFTKAKIDKVAVRSPLKCRMPQGVCSMCMGVHPNGQQYEQGENVGIVAAQSLGERAAQLMLGQTHGAGIAARGGGAVAGFKTVDRLFNMAKGGPENAILAPNAGKVERIEPLAQGGYSIYTSAHRKPLFSRQKPIVKVGEMFRKGQQLTSGDPDVHSLLRTRGVEAVQNHMVDRIGGIYAGAGVNRRHVELAVRNSTNLVRVTDPGDHPNIIRGDYFQKTVIDEINRNVLSGKRPIRYATELRALAQGPQFGQRDWMARLNTERLQQNLMTGAQFGQRSSLRGNHPIPGLAYGKGFASGSI